MKQLIDTIATIITLSEKDIDIIRSCFVKREVFKNQYILRAGNICNELLFIESGLVIHCIHNDDKEGVFYFSSEGDFFCDYDSFLNKQPSIKSFIANEDCVVYAISDDKLQLFYKEVDQGERFGRLYFESIFTKTIKHLVATFTLSAEERYLHFIDHFGHLQQRISQYHIASFIGVTPQSLSRIRRNIAVK